MALVILAGGGLLINSFLRLTRVDTGVDPANVLTAKIGVPLTPAFRPDPVKRQLHADLLGRIASLPGVRAVAVTSRLPLERLRGGLPVGTREQPKKIARAVATVISEDYFSTVGASVLSGRVFTSDDTDKATGVAIVNSTMADVLWPGASAVGKTIVYGHWRGVVQLTVIGVVTPIRYDGFASEHKPEIFVTYRQTSVVPMQLVVRTSEDPMSSVAAIRTQTRHADPTGTVTIDGVSTLERQLAAAAARPRFFAALLGAFAAAALLISALGVHGVLSFWTEQRQQEFGVRVALGATPAELYRQVLGQGTLLASVGIAIGLGIALATARTLAGLLFGITAWDAMTYAAVSLLLLVAAVAACLPAARRAATVDPVQMLRAG
jgi:putative ABC transport system permease protein